MTKTRFLLAAACALALAGCGSARTTQPAQGSLLPAVDATGLTAQILGRDAHPYFPMVPGAYKDYRLTLAGVDQPRWIRVTVGAPEVFFGRSATPLVYSAIPGLVPDSVIVGLYQYFSISPAGDLWFHGAQNGIVRSHTEPPTRNLLARPRPGEAWADTVHFESFIGPQPFIATDYVFSWTLSEVARLELPAGSFRAVRATSIIDYAPEARTGVDALAGDLSSRLGVALKPGPVDVLKGFWFARREGIVARDWPFGPGEVNYNVETFELAGEGTGPIPPPFTPPPPDS